MKPISGTAFYCCGLRMYDAGSARPICNDTYAKSFMDERGFEIVRRFGKARDQIANHAARHRFIDDYLKEKIAANPQQRIVVFGCGFDSRAFRLHGGEWIELDEPEVIVHKNEKLPVESCSNKLRRISIDFANESLDEKLGSLADGRLTIFVIEGVTMYLPTGALEASLTTLRRLFPIHEIIADLVTRSWLDTYGKSVKKIIATLGAKMIPPEDPASPFVTAGYRQISSKSIGRMIFDYKGIGYVGWLVARLFPRLMNGYTIRVFS